MVQVHKGIVEVVGLPDSLPGMTHVLMDAVEAAGMVQFHMEVEDASGEPSRNPSVVQIHMEDLETTLINESPSFQPS